MPLSSHRFFLAIIVLCAASTLSAFTVKRNVNDPTPPKEEVVIFDKDASHDHIELIPNGKECRMDFAEDGAIQIHLDGNAEANPEIRWEAGENLPSTFNAHDYNYVILRCQWSGQQTRTFPNGRTREEQPDNPWFTTTLLDTEGVRTSGLNIASITGNEAVPREMVTLKIPMALFLQTAFNDPTQLEAVAFKMGKTHDYNQRDYTFTIERIALAN